MVVWAPGRACTMERGRWQGLSSGGRQRRRRQGWSEQRQHSPHVRRATVSSHPAIVMDSMPPRSRGCLLAVHAQVEGMVRSAGRAVVLRNVQCSMHVEIASAGRWRSRQPMHGAAARCACRPPPPDHLAPNAVPAVHSTDSGSCHPIAAQPRPLRQPTFFHHPPRPQRPCPEASPPAPSG